MYDDVLFKPTTNNKIIEEKKKTKKFYKRESAEDRTKKCLLAHEQPAHAKLGKFTNRESAGREGHSAL